MAYRAFNFNILHTLLEEPQSAGEVLRIAIIDYGTGPKLDIRRWYTPSHDFLRRKEAEGRPLQTDLSGYSMGKGISIDKQDLPKVMETLQKLKDEMDMGGIEL